MSEYEDYLATKLRRVPPSGFEVGIDDLGTALAPFQAAITCWALRRGRAGIYADTGLGKTRMQLLWAQHVVRHASLEAGRSRPAIIFAPLAVAEQTVREGAAIEVPVTYCRDDSACGNGIWIANYEMLGHFDLGRFCAVVLDESSILKHHDSKTRTALIEAAQDVPYRLSCSATPSPNDLMELANQSEFLGYMTRAEMLSMFFTHDGGETQKWRLKRHGARDFWSWMASWAAVVRRPSDLGFSDEGYDLPPMRIREHVVRTSQLFGDELFPRAALSLTEQRQAQRASLADRVAECAALVASTDGAWVVWCHLNDESSALVRAIPGAEEVRGSDSIDVKRDRLDRFARGELRALVTKPSIAGFGLNWQHCHQMAFVGLSHSFESFYQAARRCWRFGQLSEVDVHLFTAETEGQVLESLKRKERQHEEMAAQMSAHMGALVREEIMGEAMIVESSYRRDVERGDGWDMHLGDCVDVVRDLENGSVDYSIFSPPFASLYTYSDSERDMGNCKDDAGFYDHFAFLVGELLRVTGPGRLCSFHCMNLPTLKSRDGFIGLKDFRGDLIRLFVDAGWIYHSEVCIWKDPVTAMQRTKAIGLLHKQLKKDAALSRQGIADYVVTMRKPGDNAKPVENTNESFPVERWQRYASPVWSDINPSRTLAFRQARESDDERHICPLQLDVIERCIDLWSNPGDLVLSPFAGIGSEGYVAVGMNRRFVGAELKEAYWRVACRHLADARLEQGDMFA